MTDSYNKLVTLLRQLFQLDRPELDFGIYRVLHARSEEVTRFLDEDLLPQVCEAFEEFESSDRARLQEELDELRESLEKAEVDPSESPKVRELERRLDTEAVDLDALERDVFDHLYRFFSRYYSEGDFLSRRVYREGVYAIPYEGEEVKLHWANADQYYTKTSEYLRDYAFRLTPENESSPMRVRFRLVDAEEGAHDNVKSDADRLFILASTDDGEAPMRVIEGETGPELEIDFEYRAVTVDDAADSDSAKRAPKQKDLTTIAVERILDGASSGTVEWVERLGRPHVPSGGEEADYTVLEAHLRRYTARNTFDYFIHKDLGGFLRRELDFYIKSELLHLDDIVDESVPRVEQYLSKVRILRRVAGKLIEFLAQLEDFQKHLWLKKKFVVGHSWCIRVDQIPEELLGEVAANDAQRKEWVDLHAIDEIERDLTRPGYSEPLTPEFVAANPGLMIDTRYFRSDFVEQLLAGFEDLDAVTDGVLFHSENFQALNLMSSSLEQGVAVVYIDPPYNTGRDDFLFRDSYQHSSWLSMISDRAELSRQLLVEDGVFVSSIGDDELPRLRMILANAFGSPQFLANFVWNNEGNIDNQSRVKVNHEYLVAFSKDDASFARPLVIAPDIGPDSKLYNDTIENSITKNGPANPPSEVRLPAGFPASFEEGVLKAQKSDWPHARDDILVEDFALKQPARLYSGWSSRSLLDDFIGNDCQPITDARGLKTWFALTSTGAIYIYKERDRQSHVLSVIRGVGTVKKMSQQLAHMGFSFSYPKPVDLIEYVCQWNNRRSATILDYFAGSGTTGHAVINLNREDGGERKFILVEMGDYFDTVLLPRLKKVTFTPEWKGGRPKRLATAEEVENAPRLLKVLRLESYEDTLNNLRLERDDAQGELLEDPEAQGPDGFKERYLLQYLLEVESRGSRSLLDSEAFLDPRAYRLELRPPGSDERRPVQVDLVETFNWLLGLRVSRVVPGQPYQVEFEESDHGRTMATELTPDEDGPWWFRAVRGRLPDGREVLIVWRTRTGDPASDEAALRSWFEDLDVERSDLDVVWVNGSSTLDAGRPDSESWTLRLIEDDFHRRMFADAS